MGKMIAMCELNCNDCIAFIATEKNDDKMREKVVEDCAYCGDFPCEELKLWISFRTVSGERTKSNLDKIRKSRT